MFISWHVTKASYYYYAKLNYSEHINIIWFIKIYEEIKDFFFFKCKEEWDAISKTFSKRNWFFFSSFISRLY